MEMNSIFKSVLNLSLSSNSGNIVTPRWSESNSIEFLVKRRYVENIVSLNASATLSLNVSALGLSSVNFVYVTVLEPNKAIKIRFNGSTTGVDLVPVDVTKRVYFSATANFSSIDIDNLSTTEPVTVGYLLVEKA